MDGKESSVGHSPLLCAGSSWSQLMVNMSIFVVSILARRRRSLDGRLDLDGRIETWGQVQVRL